MTDREYPGSRGLDANDLWDMRRRLPSSGDALKGWLPDNTGSERISLRSLPLRAYAAARAVGLQYRRTTTRPDSGAAGGDGEGAGGGGGGRPPLASDVAQGGDPSALSRRLTEGSVRLWSPETVRL